MTVAVMSVAQIAGCQMMKLQVRSEQVKNTMGQTCMTEVPSTMTVESTMGQTKARLLTASSIESLLLKGAGERVQTVFQFPACKNSAPARTYLR
jgi:hypothetical protein